MDYKLQYFDLLKGIDSSEEEYTQHVLEHVAPSQEKAAAAAGTLMSAFAKGIRYVLDVSQERGLKSPHPTISIARVTEGALPFSHGYDPANNRIFIESNYLVAAAQQLLAISNVKAIQIGLLHNSELAGVEEGHHTLFRTCKGTIHGQEPTKAYDTQDHEFRALKWQLRYARSQGFEDHEIEKLRQRIQTSRLFRKILREKEAD